jgi:uroporphyrinogen decarboxylase
VTSRDLFRLLIQHDLRDRLLVDYWAVPEVERRLIDYYEMCSREDLLQQLNVDFRYIEGPAYVGPSLEVHADSSVDDIWGVPRKRQGTGEGEFAGSYEYVEHPPLADLKTVEEVEQYPHWPDPDWYEYSVVHDQAKAIPGFIRVFMGDRLNRVAQLKPAMYLRGVERALADLARKSPVFQAINQRITDFYTEYLRRILDAARGEIDLIFTGDDFGMQSRPLCCPQTWRTALQPNFARFIQISHDAGVPVAHHTCGSIYALIPDFIASDLDILNPLQPFTADMDFARIKAEFGDRLLFHGGVSLQGALRFGTPAEVEQEVQERVEVLGKGGGYILCTAHNIQADTPTENIVALFAAYEKYRQLT